MQPRVQLTCHMQPWHAEHGGHAVVGRGLGRDQGCIQPYFQVHVSLELYHSSLLGTGNTAFFPCMVVQCVFLSQYLSLCINTT